MAPATSQGDILTLRTRLRRATWVNLQWNGTHICVTISGRNNQCQVGVKNGVEEVDSHGSF
jgi:hypothetical protein